MTRSRNQFELSLTSNFLEDSVAREVTRMDEQCLLEVQEFVEQSARRSLRRREVYLLSMGISETKTNAILGMWRFFVKAHWRSVVSLQGVMGSRQLEAIDEELTLRQQEVSEDAA